MGSLVIGLPVIIATLAIGIIDLSAKSMKGHFKNHHIGILTIMAMMVPVSSIIWTLTLANGLWGFIGYLLLFGTISAIFALPGLIMAIIAKKKNSTVIVRRIFMKKTVYVVFAVILALAFTACASDPAPVSAPAPASVTPASGLDALSMAIRGVSDYLNDTIPGGSMVVFMNVQSDFEQLSDFIIDELLANAVNDRVFTVVDRRQLDVIRAEQNLQLSGEVDDETALSVGRFLGAQMIVSGRIASLGGHYRLTIRALEVETARLQGQYNQNIGTVATIGALMGGGTRAAQAPVQRAAQAPAQPPAQQAVQVPAQQAAQAPAARPVVVIEGETLAERLEWLQANATNDTVYSIVLTADESIIPQTLAFPRARNITINLRGDGTERVISLPGSGTIFTVEAGVTLTLGNGVTLQGRAGNIASLVVVNARGGVIMNDGARIIGNTSSGSGGGVTVNEHGTFAMLGREIYGNTSARGGTWGEGGGGVFVNRGGRFAMAGGIIHNNTASASNGRGGGVLVRDAEFRMGGGEISGNTAPSTVSFNNGMGGGVAVVSWNASASFSMNGGEIFGNTASDGAGVFVNGTNIRTATTTFTMTDGEISGNTASRNGGGVYLRLQTTFTKTGGIIHGMVGTANDNRARDSGHAVISFSPRRYRNTTAGPSVRMNSATAGAAGGWEN